MQLWKAALAANGCIVGSWITQNEEDWWKWDTEIYKIHLLGFLLLSQALQIFPENPACLPWFSEVRIMKYKSAVKRSC
jgi:hypothetical protein